MSWELAPNEDHSEEEIEWLRKEHIRLQEENGALRLLMREQIALTAKMARYLGPDGGCP